MIDVTEYLMWRIGFSMEDDGIAAFTALKKLSRIEFEFATREEGWIERAQGILTE